MEIAKPPMDESERMTARYRISERDYRYALLLNGRPTRSDWVFAIIIIMVVVLIIAGALVNWHFAVAGSGWWIVGLLVCIARLIADFLVWLARVYLWSPFSYRRNKQIQDEMEIAVREDGICFTAPNRKRDDCRAMLLNERPTQLAVPFVNGFMIIIIIPAVEGDWGVAVLFIGIWIAFLLAWLASVYFQSRDEYRRNRLIDDEIEMAGKDYGVRLTFPMNFSNGESRPVGFLAWDKFRKWRYSADYVLIYIESDIFFVVPCALAQQGFDIDGFKDMPTRHLGTSV